MPDSPAMKQLIISTFGARIVYFIWKVHLANIINFLHQNLSEFYQQSEWKEIQPIISVPIIPVFTE